MFPDKPGGLSVYAREGWRKHFSLAGPIAVFGYWFAWSSVLAVYGGFIGLLLIGEFARRRQHGSATWTRGIRPGCRRSAGPSSSASARSSSATSSTSAGCARPSVSATSSAR